MRSGRYGRSGIPGQPPALPAVSPRATKERPLPNTIAGAGRGRKFHSCLIRPSAARPGASLTLSLILIMLMVSPHVTGHVAISSPAGYSSSAGAGSKRSRACRERPGSSTLPATAPQSPLRSDKQCATKYRRISTARLLSGTGKSTEFPYNRLHDLHCECRSRNGAIVSSHPLPFEGGDRWIPDPRPATAAVL